MLDVPQFRLWVIKPTLTHLGMWSPAAEQLMVGTALQESKLTYLRQFRGGPALGVYQVEPATHDDIWDYLARKPKIEKKVIELTSKYPNLLEQLQTNLCYATAIARLLYWRKPEPLPAADDVRALGAYWKRHYNTLLGQGTADEFTSKYKRYVGD